MVWHDKWNLRIPELIEQYQHHRLPIELMRNHKTRGFYCAIVFAHELELEQYVKIPWMIFEKQNFLSVNKNKNQDIRHAELKDQINAHTSA